MNMKLLWIIAPLSLMLHSYGTLPEDNALCENINKRIYTIARLQSTLHFLQTISNPQLKKSLFCSTSLPFFQHKEIQHILVYCQVSFTTDPVLLLWKKITQFKYITDDLLIEEFGLLILTMLKNATTFLLNKLHITTHQDLGMLEKNYLCFNQRLEIIDQMKSNLQRLLAHKHINRSLYKPNKIDNYTHEITQRTYQIRRFSPYIRWIKKNILFIQMNRERPLSLTHPATVALEKRLQKTKSIDSLLSLWNDFCNFKYTADHLFVKEFARILFDIIAQAMSKQLRTKKQSTITIAQLAHLYNHIEEFDFEEVLQTTDMLIEEIPHLMHQFEFDTDMSWRAWMKKYWWAPPLCITIIVSKIMIQHKLWELKEHALATVKNYSSSST